jgi:hypothetical protein
MNHCGTCGADLPAGAVACPVGAADCPMVSAPAAPPVDDPTAAIDVGALDPTASVDGDPQVSTGSGLLVVVRGPNAGSRFLLDREVTTIGRHPESHVFLDDVTVSRRHAEIRREDGQLVLHDLGSLNGTYVAGVRADEQSLEGGDELQVGRFKMAVVT